MTSTANQQGRAELPPQYAPADVESRRYEQWVADGRFAAHDNSDKPSYSIVIPPPNVTGSLHLGHAMDHTIIDMLIRRKRMQGYNALWMPGMDHAGISTQNVVERQLSQRGLSRHDLGRDAFVETVWDWKKEYGGKISGQMRRLGDSVDWDRERFTMDEGLSGAVQTIFKRLYDDELIYRAERIINWCPRCLTALSDIEVNHSDDDGELVSVRYGDGEESIVVATTRAETMLGDTGVAVHPDDERYRHLVGKTVELPLTGRRIPVVADSHVDPEFGTGAVKVTPAHDPNDFEIGQRHDLPALLVMNEHGVITTHGPFEGLDRFEARPAIVAALREQGRVVAEKRPYVHAVGHCDRCETTVEPRLSLQWFVKVDTLAEAAGAAVRDGRVKIHPPEQEKRYFNWIDNLHDWCISRQLWWGHRIPVYYGPNGETVCLGPDETPPEGYTQDPDVLDTWFSSALWPFSTLGWPEDTEALERFYPNSVLVTGYDILFFWVVRMMLFGLYAMDDVPPFKEVVLHGLIRDQFGKKMSKSAGNGVDPIEWMDAYGSDALRFTLARGANPGTDPAVGEDWVQGSRNFCNKLWNATRFALMSGATTQGPLPAREDLSTVDRWILSRLARVTEAADEYSDSYALGKLTDALYHFAWDEVCDWYLEMAKPVIAQGGDAAATTQRVLGHVLDTLLRLLHPLVPYVTEELWLALTDSEADGASIMVAEWPTPDRAAIDAEAETTVAGIERVVTEIRRFRSDQGVRPTQRVATRLDGLEATGLLEFESLIRSLARLDVPGDDFTTTATVTVTGDIVAALDTSGSIDVAAERARLEKALAAAKKELDGCTKKLGNEAFLSKAPEHVVGKIRDRKTTAEEDIERISAQLKALPSA
ncbi:MAG TPA: valine--tRNA ligase [Candidatus Stackebrandtia faecavium]|nr:valine--tRNA ligase [Candidatus Stackebrandtia faecavium]